MKQSEPIYIQLANNIEKKIISGEYKIGDKIVSERKMSEQYGINRLTVRKAIAILIERGCLSAEKGSGTYVCAVPNSSSMVYFGSTNSMTLRKQISQSGLKSSRKVISLKEIKNEKVNMFDCETLFELTRLFYIDNIPYSIQVTYFPKQLFEDVGKYDFQDDSLYSYMDSKGYMPVKFKTEMSIEKLPEEYLDILDYDDSHKLFFFEYKGYTRNDIQVEYTQSWYKPEYTKFKFKIS